MTMADLNGEKHVFAVENLDNTVPLEGKKDHDHYGAEDYARIDEAVAQGIANNVEDFMVSDLGGFGMVFMFCSILSIRCR
jgi:hypothetical protein